MKPQERGLRAHSRRGRIGRTWWSLRWTTVLESIGLIDRLHRGRSLARAGNIRSLTVESGRVEADVRGSRGESFSVEITMRPIPPHDWEALEEILARRALFAAKLLVGEMPEPIEEAFSEAGLALFPASAGEVSVGCDCDDPASPCPHAAAVFYLLAERFDQDPFLIFYFRGRSRDDLLAGLKQHWGAGVRENGGAEVNGASEDAGGAAAGAGARKGDSREGGEHGNGKPESRKQENGKGENGSGREPAGNGAQPSRSTRVPEEESAEHPVAGYWDLAGDIDAMVPRIQPPRIQEAVLRRLGPPPGSAQDSPAEFALLKAYRIASEWALKVAIREEGHES